jgi:hypothetical protein
VALIPTFRPIWAPAPRAAANRPAARWWRPRCHGPSPCPQTGFDVCIKQASSFSRVMGGGRTACSGGSITEAGPSVTSCEEVPGDEVSIGIGAFG